MRPYVIVLGNEKGGTGKSTIAMHIVVYLLNQGHSVGTIDIDARQGTFSRYFEHRARTAQTNSNIRLPNHIGIFPSQESSIEEAHKMDKANLEAALNGRLDCQFIIIDTPGNNTFLSQTAHSYADTLVTPLNDSFIDLDVLVRVEDDMKTMKPSVYAEMVWNQRKTRAIKRERPIDWIVIRNRLTTLFTKNRKDVNIILDALARRIGFRLGTGFCERVIFRELFLSGLTVLDLDENLTPLSLSHIAARQELRELIAFMRLPNVTVS